MFNGTSMSDFERPNLPSVRGGVPFRTGADGVADLVAHEFGHTFHFPPSLRTFLANRDAWNRAYEKMADDVMRAYRAARITP